MKRLERTDFDFWSQLETRWRDMDAIGHINHATFLSYMESARVDVYIKMGYSGIRKDMDESTILASMEVQYFDQASHPSTLNIGHRICRVGTKSFDLLSAIYKDTKEEPVCAALFKMVAFNYQINRAIPVPSRIVKRCRPI